MFLMVYFVSWLKQVLWRGNIESFCIREDMQSCTINFIYVFTLFIYFIYTLLFLLGLILIYRTNSVLMVLEPLWELLCWKMEESNTEWWMPVLAKPFTSIDAASILPEGWTPNTLGPLCKKGNKIDPENYRPASLLDPASTLCISFLLNEEREGNN